MKTLRYILTATAAVFVALSVWASPVSPEQARQTAVRFYRLTGNSKVSVNEADFVPVYPASVKTSGETAPCYVFNVGENNGFVIVNGDDDLQPVLGYSVNGSFPSADIPSNLRYWLDNYRKQIEAYQEAVRGGAEPVKTAFHQAKATATVPPLLENYAEGAINYNQGYPYNALCPNPYNRSNPTVTGCVATAMTQIARYHKYPAQGTGNISYTTRSLGISVDHNFSNSTYDWENMLCDYNGSGYTQTQIDAIGTLMRDIGYAAQMDYGYAESGAYDLDALYGMQTYMGYSKHAEMLYRDYYKESEWLNLLTEELDAGRPVYYTGSGSNPDGTIYGHAFVCDGYNSETYFHFNWGWGSWGNGWYWVSNLVPTETGTGAGNGEYNDNQSIAVGLRPSQGETDPRGHMLYSDNNHMPDGHIAFACEEGTYGKSDYLNATAYDMYNMSACALEFDLALVYWKNGEFVKATGLQEGLNRNSLYGWTYNSFYARPGEDVEPGVYKISVAARYFDNMEWEEVRAPIGYVYAYEVTVTDDGYTVGAWNEEEVVDKPRISPNGGYFSESVEVSLSCTTTGVDIYYSTDGTQPTILYTAPFTLTQSATVTAIAIKGGTDTSDRAIAVFTELSEIYSPVADLKELKQIGQDNGMYCIKSRVTVTSVGSKHNYFTIQDSTAGIGVSDNKGTLIGKLKVGDVFENLCVQFYVSGEGTTVDGNPIKIVDLLVNDGTLPEPVASDFALPVPVTATLAEIASDMAAYDYRLVQMENIYVTTEDAVWKANEYYYAMQEGNNSRAFDIAVDEVYQCGIPYIGTPIPDKFTLTGIALTTYGQISVMPRMKSDIYAGCENETLSETFKSGFGSFTTENVNGSAVWYSDATYGAKISGYSNGSAVPSEAWLISPIMDLRDKKSAVAEFEHAINYASTDELLKNDQTCWVSTDYSGNVGTATWHQVEISQYPAGTNWTYVNATVDFSDYVGEQNVVLAFKYQCDASAAPTWEIRNLKISLVCAGELPPLIETYTVAVNASPAEGGTVSGGGTYESGTQVQLKATANSGWKFTRWNDNVTTATRTVTVTANATYTAYFEQDTPEPQTYTLTVNGSPSNGGTVTGGGTYESGTQVQLKATANSGWKFTRWNDNVTTATRTVTVTADATYVAYFERIDAANGQDRTTAVRVYPNPSNGLFAVEVPAACTAEVYTENGILSGRYVWPESGTYSVNLQGRPAGVYYLHLISTGSSVKERTVKLVVR